LIKTIRKLRLLDLDRSTQVQSRVKTDPERLEEYKKAWETGEANFPPCIVYQHGEKLYIADGFHRIQSKMQAKMDRKVEYRTIDCEVRQGSIELAIEYSLGANLNHGLRPNTADKKRAILLYYGLSEEHCYHSNNAVAKACGASHTFVGGWKAECAKMPIDIIAAETNIPVKELKLTIENINKAIASGKIITTRGGKELTQTERKTPKPIDPDKNRHHHYIFAVNNPELGIDRGTIVSGFESLTNTGMVALAGRDEQNVVPESELIQLPYRIGSKLCQIKAGTELTVTGYAMVGTDLKIKTVDRYGFQRTDSSTTLKPYVKAAANKNIGDVGKKPTPPMIDVTKMSDAELTALYDQIIFEQGRRNLLTQNTAAMSVS
jgi:hypothetical protein